MTSTRFINSGIIKQLLFILIIILSAFFPVAGQSDEDIEEILIPFILMDEYKGEILMKIEGGEHLYSYEQFEFYLEPHLSPDALNSLRDIGESREMISTLNIRATGLEVEFREDYLDLIVNIPPIIKRELPISLSGDFPEYPGVKIKPAVLSGWANNNLLMKLVYEDSYYSVENRLDAGINFRTWVLDTSLTLSNSDELFSLNHARVIKDLPFLTCRAEAGDLTYSTDGVDGVGFITGLSLVRNFNINPGITRVPSGREPLFLEQDSFVEIEVNGKIVKELDLRSGLYSIENFGLSEGINRVRIYVTDEEGRRETTLVLPVSSGLLKEREFDFGLAAGFPERQIELPVIASYQRAGITDNLTFELKEIVPIHTRQIYIEFNGVGATVAGNIFLKAAISTILEESTDLAFVGKYNYSNILKPHWGTFGSVCNYDLIIQDLDLDLVGNSKLALSFYYVRPLTGGFFVTPSFLYSDGSEEGRRIRFNTLLRKNMGGGSALSFDMSYIWDETAGSSFTGTISFSMVFPDQNQSIMVQQNIDERKFYLNWNKFPENSYGLDINASTQIPFDTMERSTYNLGSGYSFPYGTADFRHRTATIIDSPEDTLNTSQLSFSNSFVFAGDSIGFTRTVRDSFLIIQAAGPLKDSGVRVNPAGKSQKGIAGNFNAVLSDLGSYRAVPLRLEAGELSPGMELDTDQYVFTPSFRSGSVVKVKVRENVYIGGRLTDKEGLPMQYAFGKIYPKASDLAKGTFIEFFEFFTDENGSFEIYNLRPGLWKMELENMKGGVFHISIPDEVYGYYDAGELSEIEE